MRNQEAGGQKIGQLLPEQRIQGAIALQGIGRAQEQSRCNGVRRCAVRSWRSADVTVPVSSATRCSVARAEDRAARHRQALEYPIGNSIRPG